MNFSDRKFPTKFTNLISGHLQKLLSRKMNFATHEFLTKSTKLIFEHGLRNGKHKISNTGCKFYQWKYKNYPLIILEMGCNVIQIRKSRICNVG